MKISIVGPGIMPIPPTGWGAVEILIWDSKNALEKLGHKVQIIITKNGREIIDQINSFKPDFVHIQYDEFVPIMEYIQYPCAITSHFGYLEQTNKWDYYGERIAKPFSKIKPNVFCLSDGIADTYLINLGIPHENLFVTPNGVNVDKFRVENIPERLSDSIYLAKIDYRKRQHLFQSIKNLYYAGNNADPRFDTSNNYLGEWSKETLYNDLTKYGNLVLLSDGEAHPLVCLEAFAAGLGVVVSQWAAANLDTSKDFISVIPEDKISDIEFVENEILQNKFYSINHRQEILDYAKTFNWTEVVKNYYIPAMETIIGNYK